MSAASLLLVVPVLCSTQAPAQPKLALAEEHYDFGPVPRDTTVTHRLSLRNAGDAPLKIRQVVATCGCTSTMTGKDRLAPGESTEILVAFNTMGLVGKVQKTVTVESDDPAQPERVFTFDAEVVQPVAASETQVWFRDLTRRDRRKHSVRLRSLTGRPALVEDIAMSKAPWLGVATRAAGNDQWVDLDLLARNLPAGKLAGTDTLDVQLRNPLPSSVHLDVHWQLRSPVRFSPERVAWVAPQGQEQHAQVSVAALDRRPFRILSVRTSTPLLAVAPLRGPAAAKHTLDLTLAGEAPAGALEERVFLTLDLPGHPEVEFRVAAALK